MSHIYRDRFDARWACLPLQVVAGAIFFTHGLQKFSDPVGYGQRILESHGIPWILIYLVIAAELGGSLLMLTGLLVRFAAFSQLCVMVVAIATVHWQNGITGSGGFEFPLSILAVCLSLLLLGGDPLSLDHNIGILGRKINAAQMRNEGEFINYSSPAMRVSAILIFIGSVCLPIVTRDVPIPDGRYSYLIFGITALVSIAASIGLLSSLKYGFILSMILARLYFCGGVLMLLFYRHTILGVIAIVISILVLLVLSDSKKSTSW